LLYVNDIVITACSTTLLQQTIYVLKREFAMKDLKPHLADMLFLTLRQYALDILERAGMVDCKPILMSVDTHAKLSTESKPPIADLIQYTSLIGALQ
jgi:hypothetical protein